MFDSRIYRQIIGIQMGNNCAPLATHCFCFVMRETSCYPYMTKIRLLRNSTLLYDNDNTLNKLASMCATKSCFDNQQSLGRRCGQ